MPHDSPKTIKEAYRKLVMQYHPDLNPGQNNTLILQEINEAFEVLSDPERKKIYDLQLYKYIQNLQNSNLYTHTTITQNNHASSPKTEQRKIYIKRKIKFKSKKYDTSSKFVKPKDFVIPLIVIIFFTIIAFTYRYFKTDYKYETYRKSAINIDIYSVNLNGKLPTPYLPSDFFDFTQITQLDLSNNNLTYLSPKFGNLKNLRALNLNNNYITQLNDGFTTMNRMVFLNLSNNPLKEFPEEILSMKNLEVLWLNHCGLKEIPIEKMNFPKLKYLFLAGNKLSLEQKKLIQKKFSNCYIVF